MKTLNSFAYPATTAHGRRLSMIPGWMAIGAACLLLPSAQASLLWQESFDYESTLPLAGQGTWAVTTNSAFITVGSVSLTYVGLAEVTPRGNSARTAGLSAPGPSFTYSPFTAPAFSGAVYASFLLDFYGTVAGGNYTFMGLLPYSNTGAGNGGNFNNTYDPCDLISRSSSGNVQLGIRTLAGTTTYASPTLALGSTSLIVLKYDFDAKKAFLFINPELTSSEPATADASSTGMTAAASLGQFYVRVGGNNQGPYMVDSVRVGTTWGDVIVVPEPSALALLGLGVLGLGLSRRTRG